MSPTARSGLRGTAVALGCATVLSAVLCLYAFTMPLMLGDTIAHSREILTAFKAADRKITAYRSLTGRLPSPNQIVADLDSVYHITIIDPATISSENCCPDAIRSLGVSPRGSYLLEVWRGEWSEYYAPWSGRSTLTFDPDDYAVTGNLIGDIVLSIVLFLALSFGTLRVWRASAAPSCT
jgi:hypothetical protein